MLQHTSSRMLKNMMKMGVAKHFKAENIPVLEQCIAAIKADDVYDLASTEAAYNKIAADNGLALGKVIHPTRLALTGRTVSPGYV